MIKYNDTGMRKFTRKEIDKIYSSKLRDLETSSKKDIMVEFIKEKINFSKVKDFIEGTENASKYIVDLSRIGNLDYRIYKEQFELEQIFLYSVLHTECFKEYALNFNNNKVEV